MGTKSLTPPREAGLGPRAPGEKRPARAPLQINQPPPQMMKAGLQTKVGAANEAGLGIPRQPPGGLGQNDIAVDGSCDVMGDKIGFPNFACSTATRDFLRVNVLRNPGDFQIVIQHGIVPFNAKVGRHVIPFSKTSPTGEIPNNNGKNGAFIIPAGQVLIVTDFMCFAFQGKWGLPGQLEEIDPSALVANVAFSLMQENNTQAFEQQALIGGLDGRFVNGTPFLRDCATFGYPALTQNVKASVEAVYEVFVPPYPGFPEFVGARLKGYLVNQQLLSAVLDRPETE